MQYCYLNMLGTVRRIFMWMDMVIRVNIGAQLLIVQDHLHGHKG